jgi:hypothetical protein
MSEIKSKIGLTPKGAYSSSVTYDYLDYVTNADGTYTSKQANNVGHALTDTDWWEHDFVAPRMRVNATSKNWEISYDGGASYADLGVSSKGTDAVSPQLKIDTTTFNWMLSTDGGTTWTDLGVASKQATSSAVVLNKMIGSSGTDVISQKAINDFFHLAKGIDLSEVSERGDVDLYTGSLISSTTALRYELAVNNNNDLTITYNNIRTDGHTIKISWCYLDSSKSNPDHVYVEGITISGETKIEVPSDRPYMRFAIYEYDGTTSVQANLSKGELVLNNGIENLVVQEHGFSTEKTVSQYGISKIAYGVFDQEDRLIYEDTSGVIHKKKFTTAPTSLYSSWHS